MPIVVACPSCGSKLRVPDNQAGRKGKCPQCGAGVRVDAAAAPADVTPVGLRPGKPRVREVFEPEKLAAAQPAEAEPAAVRGTPARRRKRRPKKRAAPASPSWLWWLGGLGAIFALSLVAIVLAVRAGYTDYVIYYGIWLVLMLPVSTVILILSMILSSHLGGGIDFGQVHTAVAKSACLILVVDLICLIPFGWVLAFPVWLFGLMYLFGLDLSESRFLVSINWVLNTVANLVLVAALMSLILQGRLPGGLEGPLPPGLFPAQQERDFDD